jgi:hypothetical protein
LTVAYECAANAVGVAASVNITRCGIAQNAAGALPGPASVVAGTEDLALAPFRLCWTATATFVDAKTRTTSGCTAPMEPNTGKLSGAGASAAV